MMAATIHALVRAGAIGLPPERADDLEKVASVDGEIRPALIDAIDTIQFRARMYDAFAAVPRVQPVQP
jgi:hypothetical protein